MSAWRTRSLFLLGVQLLRHEGVHPAERAWRYRAAGPLRIRDSRCGPRPEAVAGMRRAGADIKVQRAILGHKEAGAIRHYDDGPEFDVKRRWINATDPRVL